MRIVKWQRLLRAAMVCCVSSCQSPEPVPPPHDVEFQRDQQAAGDFTPGRDARPEVVEDHSDGDVDPAGPDAGDAAWFRERDLRCNERRAPITYSPADVPFATLERGGTPRKTKTDIERDFSNDLPEEGEYFLVDPALDPGRHMRVAFAERGEDVNLYYASIWTRQEPQERYLSITTLVDYQPVEAEYILWNDDYSESQARVVDTGAHFPMDEQIELVQVRLPAAAFPEDRYYEIGFAARGGSPADSRIGVSIRLALFYGGFNRSSHPCFQPTELSEPSEVEARLWDDVPHPAIVYPADIQSSQSLEEPMETSSGARIVANFAIQGSLNGSEQHYAYVALMNGRPVHPTWYVVRAKGDIADLTPNVALRGMFDLSIPEQPGIYDVVLVPFPHAFWPTGNPDGSWNEVQSFISGGHSPILRLRVPPT